MNSAMRRASGVIPSCFAITFELQRALEQLHFVTLGITHADILNTYCPSWRAVHMLSLAAYEKFNCSLCLQPSARTPYGTTHST